jgi:putative glutamine amidotransferase
MAAIIGITSGTERRSDDAPVSFLSNAYLHAIIKSGGIPVLIPALLADARWKRIYPHMDGILFSGGGDIDVGLFAGSPHPAVHSVDPSRDALELSLLRAVAEDEAISGHLSRLPGDECGPWWHAVYASARSAAGRT